jgi:hypothetical protein
MAWWEEYKSKWREWLDSVGLSGDHVEVLMQDKKTREFFFDTVMELERLEKINNQNHA